MLIASTLAAFPSGSAASAALDSVGIALLDLGRGQPRPLADVDLAQAPVERNRKLEPCGEDLGGLTGTPQVRRVERQRRIAAQQPRERARLVATPLVQCGYRRDPASGVPGSSRSHRDGRGALSSPSRRLR